jgi:hypothetical protein
LPLARQYLVFLVRSILNQNSLKSGIRKPMFLQLCGYPFKLIYAGSNAPCCF